MIIQTLRLILRPITQADASEVYAYSSNPFVGPDAGWKPHESIDESKVVIASVFENQRGVFGIVLRQSGVLIGSVGLVADPKRENQSAWMLGYALAKECWGQGYVTEAAKAVIAFGFNTLGANIISVCHYPFNERSRRVIEKCGFVREGCLRRAAVRFDGEVFDEVCWSMTVEEFRAL